MGLVIALDVGGTRIKTALVARDGTAESADSYPTRSDLGPEAVTERIKGVTQDLLERARADGEEPLVAGIAVPGLVDQRGGRAISSSNIGWRDVPLADEVRAATGVPVVLTHDVRAGGVAESRLGAARGLANVLFVPVGTGIGGAVIIDGRPVEGAHHAAAEIGHLKVTGGRPGCRCGADGCVETVASAEAIARILRERTGEPTANAEAVVAGAQAGDPVATEIWQDAIESLAEALAIATMVLDPEMIVVGGGLSISGSTLLAPLRAAVDRRTIYAGEARIVGAQLGDRAGCLGAGLMAWDRHDASPRGRSS